MMHSHLLIFLLLVVAIAALVYWGVKISILYRKRKIKLVILNSIIFGLLFLITCWQLRIIPLAADLDFRNQTKDLTGKQFWCWNDYRYREGGVRGEGFTFEIYNLDDEMATYFAKPDDVFFKDFPNRKFKTSKWKETPILDTAFMDYMTPIYGQWSTHLQHAMEEKQRIVKEIAKQKGSYFAMKQAQGTELYLISPKQKLIIFINHNM